MVYNRVQALIIYSSERAEIIRNRIKWPEKVFVASNTLDTVNILKLRKEFNQNKDKEQLKKELGFHYQLNLIYVGRLIKQKGIDDLIECFEAIDKNTHNIGLHIIGEGPEREKIIQLSVQNTRIHYHGAIFNDRDLAPFLYFADILVNPGYLGLSIVHALGYGTPVIAYKNSPTGPFHSPEYEYIKDGYNGNFVEKSPESLKNQIEILYNNPEKIREYSMNCLHTVEQDCSLDKMVKGFEAALAYVG